MSFSYKLERTNGDARTIRRFLPNFLLPVVLTGDLLKRQNLRVLITHEVAEIVDEDQRGRRDLWSDDSVLANSAFRGAMNVVTNAEGEVRKPPQLRIVQLVPPALEQLVYELYS